MYLLVLHDYRFLYQDRLNNDKASSRLPWSFQLTWRSGAWPADSPFRRTPSGARREKGISLLPGLEDETHSRTNFSPVGSSWLDVVRGQGLFSRMIPKILRFTPNQLLTASSR